MVTRASGNPAEKIVGILGGMGPWATWAFCQNINAVTPAQKDWDHLRLLVDCNVKIPSRTRAVLYGEISPVSGMVESIRGLASLGASFVVVPCNSAHYFYDQVVPQIPIPWVNMMEVTAKVVQASFRNPLILGGYITLEKRIYKRHLSAIVYPVQEDLRHVYDVIEELKIKGTATLELRNFLVSLVERYKVERLVDSLILACTEFTILIQESHFCGLPVVDSSLEYARAVVRIWQGHETI